MAVVRGILDRIILVLSIIVAGCVPSFIAQYRQRLGGRLDQVLEDLALFQEIANRYHGGSLQALIQHHLDSPDATFHDEGAAIQVMVETAERLRESLQALNADLMHQLVYLIRGIDPQIARATWEVYQPSFPLSVESVAFAFIVGVVIWLAFLAVWHLIGRIVPPARRTAHR